VDEARDFPAALGADTDVVTGFRAIGLDTKALVAGRDELDRPVEPSCRQRNKPGAWRELRL
jgi:hypothetical protein